MSTLADEIINLASGNGSLDACVDAASDIGLMIFFIVCGILSIFGLYFIIKLYGRCSAHKNNYKSDVSLDSDNKGFKYPIKHHNVTNVRYHNHDSKCSKEEAFCVLLTKYILKNYSTIRVVCQVNSLLLPTLSADYRVSFDWVLFDVRGNPLVAFDYDGYLYHRYDRPSDVAKIKVCERYNMSYVKIKTDPKLRTSTKLYKRYKCNDRVLRYSCKISKANVSLKKAIVDGINNSLGISVKLDYDIEFSDESIVYLKNYVETHGYNVTL